MKIKPISDSAIKLDFPGNVTPRLNQTIQQFCIELQAANIRGITEWVPAFNSITIYYEPTKILFHRLEEKVLSLSIHAQEEKAITTRVLHIPVLYGGEVGPDLGRVANYNNLPTEEVINLHQDPEYLVYMIGFLPGFPYLGGLNKKIATPRLDEPRASTFAGAVGIAHEQTGIYPMESPGGWNIIGKTPIKIFDPTNVENPFQFRAGDLVKFYSVTEKEYQEIEYQVINDKYLIYIEETGRES